MKFSVVVPVYNTAMYLNRCVESVLNQSFKDYEIILIDDGSTDESMDICNQYSELDKRIVTIHQDNKGSSAARNVGIDNASGDYICFLDSDDYYIDFDLLKKANDILSIKQSDVLFFNYRKVYDNGKSSSPVLTTSHNHHDISLDHIFENNFWIACAWNKIVRRDLFSEFDLNFRVGITSEDIDWCVRLALCTTKIDYIDCVGIGYFQRNESISKSITYNKVCCLRDNIINSIEIVNSDKSGRGKYLYSYIGYQVGTLIYLFAQLEDVWERINASKNIKILAKWLDYSKSFKIRVLRISLKIMGFKLTVFLLRLENAIKKLIRRVH